MKTSSDSRREYFVDGLIETVPESLAFSGESREHFTELTTVTLSEVARWLKSLSAAEEPRNDELIARIVATVNMGAECHYEKDDVQNNICVSLFLGLDYETIGKIRHLMSARVAEMGNRYLAAVDGENYRPF